MFRTTRTVLSAPLPRVFSKPPAGGAATNGGAGASTSSSNQQPLTPVDAGAIGGAFDGDAQHDRMTFGHTDGLDPAGGGGGKGEFGCGHGC